MGEPREDQSDDQEPEDNDQEPEQDIQPPSRKPSRRRVDKEEAELKPEPEECPDCGALIKTGAMGNHQFRAHGKDRRAPVAPAPKRKEKPKQESKPKAQDEPESEPEEDDSPAPKKSRWWGERAS